MADDKKKKEGGDKGGGGGDKPKKEKAPAGEKAEKAAKGEGGEKKAAAAGKGGGKGAAPGKGDKGKKGEKGEGAAAEGGAPVVVRTGPPRLRVLYEKEIAPQLMKDFKFKNKMQVPRLTKITLNMGLGEAIQNPKVMDSAVEEL